MSDSIVDTTKPSAGRMYDYMLGGSHNFDIDRQAVDYMVTQMPFLLKFARLQRWGLFDVADELTRKRGFDVFIDFASGLPTADHIHHNVPAGTTVIYSDFDPVVVEYSREILQGTPNVHFILADATRPEELLALPEVQKILAGQRKVAFGFWGCSSFLTDAQIRHTLGYLYDWAAPGSCLAYNAQAVVNEQDEIIKEMLKMYADMGAPFFVRSLEQHQSLLGEWKLENPGFIDLLGWHGFSDSELGKEDKSVFGPFGGGFGAYLDK